MKKNKVWNKNQKVQLDTFCHHLDSIKCCKHSKRPWEISNQNATWTYEKISHTTWTLSMKIQVICLL